MHSWVHKSFQTRLFEFVSRKSDAEAQGIVSMNIFLFFTSHFPGWKPWIPWLDHKIIRINKQFHCTFLLILSSVLRVLKGFPSLEESSAEVRWNFLPTFQIQHCSASCSINYQLSCAEDWLFQPKWNPVNIFHKRICSKKMNFGFMI